MAVVTLAEFNQAPSRMAQLAESEPVRIQQDGQDYLILQREEPPEIAAMRAAGLIIGPKNRTRNIGKPPHISHLTPEEGEKLYEEFLADRRGY